MKNNLSVVVLTKDSETTIKRTLQSVSKIATEILIIDDNSIDKTVKIAKTFSAKIYKKTLIDFSSQRNFGLKKAKGEWILFIDSDEVVDRNLAKEINHKIKDSKANGYFIKRKNIFWNKEIKYGEAGNVKLLRLARKTSGKWVRNVHEYWDIKGETGELKNKIIHYPHQSIEEFLKHIKKFSSLHALENQKEGKRSSIFKVIVWPIGKFFYNYILRLGFLDGLSGLIFAIMMSVHSFLSWSKLWLIQKK